MPGLSINQIIMAALAVAVVIAALWGGKGIAHGADKIIDLVGIPIGSPSIRSFTATPDGNGNMQFHLSLAHITNDIELLIYQLYTPTPDKDLDNMAPHYKSENIVFDLLPDTTTEAGQKLGEELVNGVINKLCPPDASGTKGMNGCDASITFKPGGYKFVAGLRKRDESAFIDSKDAITGFYDENYVEMLNTPVFGCSDDYFGNCNVIACKKELVNKDLLGASNLLEVRRTSGVLRKISNEFRAEKGFSASNDCGKIGNTPLTPVLNNRNNVGDSFFVLEDCSNKDIDDLNIKVVRARLLEAAFEGSIQSIDSEDKYVEGLDRLDFWKKQAVGMTMSCTDGWMPAPKGANGALQSLGWQFVSPDGKTDVWKDKINTELNRVLDSLLKPVIIDPVAGTNKDNQLELAWKLPVGKDALTQYQLKLSHSSAALDKELKDANKLVLPTDKKIQDVAVQQPGKSDLLFKYPDAGSLTSAQMGAYWFELAAFDSQGESSKVDLHTGMYDNNYIELYRDLKDVDDACDGGCDVIGMKEAALGNPKLGLCRPSDENCDGKYTGFQLAYLELAFNKHEAEFQFACHPPKLLRGNLLDANWLTSGCMPNEIDILYREVVTTYVATLLQKNKDALPVGKRVADLLSVDCNKDKWIEIQGYQTYKDNDKQAGIQGVCNAKNSLKKSLDGFHWGYTGS